AALLSLTIGLAMTFASNAHAISADDIATSVTRRFEESNLGEGARYACVVVDVETGERIVEINAGVPMKPASLTKMFTASTALDQLGPAKRFYTTIETDGTIDEKGTLNGD